jgi:RNA polymerase sigma factor (sigma-70 family)
MTEQPTGFKILMERLRDGCPQAARELFDLYGGHVRRVVRRRLSERLRSQYDSTDFAQAVWASFFTTRGNYDFNTPDALVAFLAGMAFNKVAEAYRNRVLTAKRDPRREQPLTTLEGETTVPADRRQPTPSQLAVANEEWERLIRDQPVQYRTALLMLSQGYTQAEAAAHVGLDPRQIRRLLDKLHRDPPSHE